MRFLDALQKTLAIVPFAVRSAEAAFGAGKGAEKKQAVVAQVQAGLKDLAQHEPTKPEEVAEYAGYIGGIVDNVVSILNSVGVLKPHIE